MPTFHVTLFGLGESSERKAMLHEIALICRDTCQDVDGLTLTTVGLEILGDAVVAMALDQSDSLRPLIERIHRSLRERDIDLQREIGVHFKSWWITCVRLADPVDADLKEFVARHRSSYFGHFTVETIELVETSRLFDPAKTRVLASIHLGTSAQSSRDLASE
jgi:hypothetical protein